MRGNRRSFQAGHVLVLTVAAVFLGTVPGCGRDPASRGAAASPAPEPLLVAVRAADARGPVPALPSALAREEALLLRRARPTDAVARLGRLALHADASVRAAAAFALGAFDREAKAELLLLGLLLREQSASVRASALEALGRVTVDAGLPALLDGLDSGVPAVQAGACAGLARRSMRGIEAPAGALAAAAIVARAAADSPARLACVWFLGASARAVPERGAGADASSAVDSVREALIAAATSDDDDVRRAAVRALAKQPGRAAFDALIGRTQDPDWRVAAEAFRAAGAHPEAQRSTGALVLVAALRARLLRATQELARPTALEAHVLREAVQSLGAVARETSAQEAAAELLARATAWAAQGPGGDRRRAALIACAASEVQDRARGWPSAVESCGVPLVTDAERRLHAIRVVAMNSAPEAQRLAYLRAALRELDPRVVEAALAELPQYAAPEVPGLLAAALAGPRPRSGVWATACEAAAGLDRARASGALAAAVAEALPALSSANQLEALQACAKAAGHLGVGARALEELARGHANPAVRGAAASALTELGLAAPSAAPDPRPALPPGLRISTAPATVRFETSAGVFEIGVDARRAPVTAARFLSLVAAGFYDGLTFHRVVPGFVVQGGDPDGDGFGGPPWSLRDEESAEPFVRGSVGMALAGRDTGGSQFFVTYGREPRLDGDYPLFGSVTRGMDVVDAIVPGDRILRATVLAPPSAGAGSAAEHRD